MMRKFSSLACLLPFRDWTQKRRACLKQKSRRHSPLFKVYMDRRRLALLLAVCQGICTYLLESVGK